MPFPSDTVMANLETDSQPTASSQRSFIDALPHGKVFTRGWGENGWTRRSFLHSSRFMFRALLLFFTTFLLIGPAFQYEFPSALQGYFETSQVDADGKKGLNMGPMKYNLLFAVYAWSCGFTILFSSSFVERNYDQLMILFGSFVCCSGSVCISLGAVPKTYFTCYLLAEDCLEQALGFSRVHSKL